MSDRVAVVTGGAAGIGEAIGRRLARTCRIAIVDRDGAAARDRAKAIEEDGGSATAIEADLAERADIDALLQSLESVGRVGVLINNAGITRAARLAETEWALWDAHLKVNLDAGFALSRGLADQLCADGAGRILFVSSHSALLGSSRRAAYAATKAAALGLMRVLAVELGARGVTVNAVAPGAVETPHVEKTHTAERRAAWASALPIKRYALPDEVAAAVEFLAGPDAAMITGQTLAVDGGFTIAGLMTDA